MASAWTSGRLSHSSGHLNGTQSCGSLTDNPLVSPPEVDDSKYCRSGNTLSNNQFRAATPGATATVVGAMGGNKTVGKWLNDRREKKKEETRAQNAQLHAAISVARVAVAVAAIAAATAASSGAGKDERAARTDMAVASAATKKVGDAICVGRHCSL